MSQPTAARSIFVNLPVQNLTTAVAFYQALGFVNNPQFSDQTAACMVWSEHIYLMLLTHAKWQTFTSRPIPATNSSEVMLAVALPDRAAVDTMATTAAQHGGQADINPRQEHGFMYSRSLADPDGHVWEAFWLDPATLTG